MRVAFRVSFRCTPADAEPLDRCRLRTLRLSLCEACPPHSSSTEGSAACACDRGYVGTGTSRQPCTECPTGTYKSAPSTFGCAIGAKAYSACRKYLPEALLGGGWRLVRHLPPGSATWHPATDRLEGTDSYGNSSLDSVAWSVPFGSTTGELLFAGVGMPEGDVGMWLLTTKTAATGDYYENILRDITKSSEIDSPHQRRWFHLDYDRYPAISLFDWNTARYNKQILYLGDSYATPPPSGKTLYAVVIPLHPMHILFVSLIS